MRWFARSLLLAAGIAAPACGAQVSPVSVEQVSQLLETSRPLKDARLARKISELQLTERADPITLSGWQAEAPGKQARRALTELADASAFLDPPKSEDPAKPQPATADMSQMLERAVDYVNKTMPRLPNFYAVRTTTHFENAAAFRQDLRGVCNGAALPSACLSTSGANTPSEQTGFTPLRFEGESAATVTYRDGKELANRRWETAFASKLPQLGLVTTGEFGPILVVALSDALHGKIFWGFWQRGSSGPLAVFRFTVAKNQSHFQVTCPTPAGVETTTPAYHGELAIDPSTGAVYRITMISDLDPPYQDQQASIAVDYGTVSIGGTPYICPVRGVALSRVPVFTIRAGQLAKLPVIQTRLNDVIFTRYHLFRTEMKILPDPGGSPGGSTASPRSPRP